jgi:membrane-associated phospholipid phosphatase
MSEGSRVDRVEVPPADPLVTPSPLATRLGARSAGHPVRVAVAITAAGILIITPIVIGFGEVVMRAPSIDAYDHAAVDRIEPLRADLETYATIGSFFGESLVLGAVTGVAMVVLAVRRRWIALGLLAVGVVVEGVVSLTASTVVARPRPWASPLDPTPDVGSFPSGHTAGAVVIYGTLAAIVAARVERPALRRLAWGVAVGLSSAVGVSRIVLGMHHPADEAGSLLEAYGSLVVGLIAVGAAVVAERSHDRRTDVPSSEPAIARR